MVAFYLISSKCNPRGETSRLRDGLVTQVRPHETPRETDTSETQPRRLSRPYFGLVLLYEKFLSMMCSGFSEHCSDLIVIPTSTSMDTYSLRSELVGCGWISESTGD